MVFFLKRIGQGLLVIWGIVSLLFLIFYTLGDPVEYVVGEQADDATRQAIREKYGLDQPLYHQYFTYLGNLLPLGSLPEDAWADVPHLKLWSAKDGVFALKAPNFGRSYQTNQAVNQMIGRKVEGTLVLALAAILFAAVVGISLGVLAALKRESWVDRSILSVSVLGISAPSFFIGVLVAWLFAVKWKSLTGLNISGHLFEENIFDAGRSLQLKNLFLPALALGVRPLAVFIQLTRSSMIEVLEADYIRTARAKGLSAFKVVAGHALRNALNPVMTSVTGWLASLLAGAFFIEYIFNWQGIGKLTIDALDTKDFPVILGCAMFIGAIFVLVSILTDVVYRWLDPRVNL
ncbi:MAG: ABC transporter permease [Bacteroidota bacterium]